MLAYGGYSRPGELGIIQLVTLHSVLSRWTTPPETSTAQQLILHGPAMAAYNPCVFYRKNYTFAKKKIGKIKIYEGNKLDDHPLHSSHEKQPAAAVHPLYSIPPP